MKDIIIVMKKALLVICAVFSISTKAQVVGTEQIVNKEVFTGTFIVNGDKDKYYPVVFKSGNQNLINNIRIYRSYSEPGPSEFSPTHKGGLLLDIDVNYGGWGGITYDWRINDLRQAYHETFGGAQNGMHNIGFIVFLRGGGFRYHYQSDKAANIQIALNSDIIYDHSHDPYDAFAPAPLDEPNKENINSHKLIDGITNTSGNIGIGTNTPDRKLTVQGHVNIGGTTNAHLWVRHINGKEPTTNADSNLYLNYGNGHDVHIGGSSNASGSDLYIPKGKIIVGSASTDVPLAVRAYSEDIISRFENKTSSDKVKGIRLTARNSNDQYKYLDLAIDAEHEKIGLGIGTSSGNLPIAKTNLDLAQIVIDRNGGNVGIGTANPDEKLAVNGTIHAKEVRVDLNNWPDYVFESTYKLPTLEEVEQQIKEKGHLPNIPSAEEVEKNGAQLGEMNKKLLEKIEELTLYTIQQEKDNKKMLLIIEKLEERISELEKK
ncbi:hypothetical protein [Tenacibaculum sp. 190524A05c]|uniref:Peptidase S74 domain-containing protein n=1 Tax=Tenacibaculum platacis TaxID=3137852 RepID=A0ABM9NXP3_9FLAO